MSDTTTDTGGTNNTASTSEELPGWAREKLTAANNEAASKRVQLKEVSGQLETANEKVAGLEARVNTLTDESSGHKADAETANKELTKLKAALSAGIPGDRAADFASRLQGETDDELAADAKKMAELVGTDSSAPATDPSQGRGNNTNVGNTPSQQFANMLRTQLEGVQR